jgi:hypothetical protein
VALAAPRNGIIEIAGPERAPFNEIVARYLKATGDPRQIVCDPEARYWGGRVEEHSLVPLGEARLGRIGLDEWVRRCEISSQINDGPVRTYKARESFSELPGDRHAVSANASKTKPAKLLAVFVVDTNETELTIPFGK